MEKYFESLDKAPNDKIDLCAKKKELVELNNLGYCYQFGIGKKKDEFKALEIYFKSAEGGYPGAQNNLGYCYQNGIGIEKDEKEAFEWYSKAANEGRGLVTHDQRTMPYHFAEFIANRQSPGVFIIPQRLAIGAAIDELLLIWSASESDEWTNSILYLPL